MDKRTFTAEETRLIGDALGIDWSAVDLEQFRIGISIELEHGRVDPSTNVTDDDMAVTAKIVLAHLKEYPDYYTRLEHLEEEAEAFWKDGRPTPPSP